MEMAYRLKTFFDYQEGDQRLADIEGMTPERADRIRRHFFVDPEGTEVTPGSAN
jgi:hypothetical protein